MIPFSDRLREIRETLGLSQNEFSKRLGGSRVSLTHYEAGDRTPDIDFLTRLHLETGISLYYLLGLTDSKEDSLATAQKENGLSEKALTQLTSDDDTTDLVNQFLNHDDFPDFAHRLMVIHDNELVMKKLKQNTMKGMLATIRLKEETTALAERILHSDPTSFGIDEYELPIVAGSVDGILLHGLRAIMEKFEAMYPNPTEEDKQLFAQGVNACIQQFSKPIKETSHAQETPES